MNEWISVKERLPKVNGVSALVMIYHPKRQCILTAYRYPLKRHSKKYYWMANDIDGGLYLESDQIQFWMPLPDPPKL